MKTTAKWINENYYILDNSKHLNLVVSDPGREGDRYEVNCLDLLLMSFAGCITAEFKKQIIKQSILLKDIETSVEIETFEGSHPCFGAHLICSINSNAKAEKLEECMNAAIDSSFMAILFKNAGITIRSDLKLNTPARQAAS